MIYDPETNSFDELAGIGLPLGVFEDSSYQTLTHEIKPRQIIAIGTDGIWETTNAEGQQFGKERFKDVIQAHLSESAAEIVTRVINEVDGFAGKSEKSDDVTLVIIKVEVQ
jgi:sigma-B regulation protein RsbU (phosphoserine phosphatase)